MAIFYEKAKSMAQTNHYKRTVEYNWFKFACLKAGLALAELWRHSPGALDIG